MAREGGGICFILTLSMFSLMALSEAFDSFWMVYQWPPSVCIAKDCSGTVEHMFIINGFWAHSKSRGIETNCDPTSHLSIANIRSIEDDLSTYWPDVISGNNRRKWSQQWSKYGTCSDLQFDQLMYFTQALNNRLNHRYDLEGILLNAGIAPTGSTPFRDTQVKSIIAHATGKEPILNCDKIAGTSTTGRLVDIILCFAADGSTLVNCPPNMDRCPPNFFWLPHNSTTVPLVANQ